MRFHALHLVLLRPHRRPVEWLAPYLFRHPIPLAFDVLTARLAVHFGTALRRFRLVRRQSRLRLREMVFREVLLGVERRPLG